MTCSLCEWLSKRLGLPNCDEITAAQRDDWERAESNEYELWSEQPPHVRDLAERASALELSDPEAALELFREAAEAGSAWALEAVGWHYEVGDVVAKDLDQAAHFYHRATGAGSWMATLHYARVLAKQGDFARSEEVLQNGIEKGFTPSYYWLASSRYYRSPTASTCREIRPLLEHAAAQGHPAAKLMLARLMARGKFGVRNILKGLREIWALVPKYSEDEPDTPPRPTLGNAVA